jgi:hypothetical protein
LLIIPFPVFERPATGLDALIPLPRPLIYCVQVAPLLLLNHTPESSVPAYIIFNVG